MSTAASGGNCSRGEGFVAQNSTMMEKNLGSGLDWKHLGLPVHGK